MYIFLFFLNFSSCIFFPFYHLRNFIRINGKGGRKMSWKWYIIYTHEIPVKNQKIWTRIFDSFSRLHKPLNWLFWINQTGTQIGQINTISQTGETDQNDKISQLVGVGQNGHIDENSQTSQIRGIDQTSQNSLIKQKYQFGNLSGISPLDNRGRTLKDNV